MFSTIKNNLFTCYKTMNKNHTKPKEPPICYCSGTTQTKIEELIADGCDTLEKIANETGAVTGCGACEYDIQELIGQSK